MDNKDKKDKNVAAILAFFLGGLGFHKFYLGQTNQGILYLLLFWTFVPAIIAFVECIQYLCMSQQQWDILYNSGVVELKGDNSTQLKNYHEMLKSGIITQEEFDKKKKELL